MGGIPPSRLLWCVSVHSFPDRPPPLIHHCPTSFLRPFTSSYTVAAALPSLRRSVGRAFLTRLFRAKLRSLLHRRSFHLPTFPLPACPTVYTLPILASLIPWPLSHPSSAVYLTQLQFELVRHSLSLSTLCPRSILIVSYSLSSTAASSRTGRLHYPRAEACSRQLLSPSRL